MSRNHDFQPAASSPRAVDTRFPAAPEPPASLTGDGPDYARLARDRLICVCVGNPPASVQAAAKALGLDVRPVAPREFISEQDAATAGYGQMIWASVDDHGDEGESVALLSVLQQAALRRSCRIALDAAPSRLDAVWSAVADIDECTVMMAPSANETMLAVASLAASCAARLHDATGQQRDHQLEQLQMEVQRIVEMLARMRVDGGSGGGPAGTGYSAAGANGAGPAQASLPAAMTAGTATPLPLPPQVNPYSLARPDSVAREIRQLIRRRRLREEFFPSEMFADPAWDMLLDLYASSLEGARVSVSSLCIAAAVPATTALRWIKTMTDTGMFIRQADPRDGRRIFVALSDDTTAAMARYFAKLGQD